MKILQLTPHFSPNIGGVETHIDDLVLALRKRGHQIFVLSYQPLQTKVPWKLFEKKKGIKILRIPWIKGLFYTFIHKPFWEFLYLFPGLFLVSPFVILFEQPNVVHAHGLVAGAVAVFWGRILRKRVVISTHNIYNFPPSGLNRAVVDWIFNGASHVLCLSSQSAAEIRNIVKDNNKVSIFTSWVDLKKFHPIDKKISRAGLGWSDKFIVLFVGRLVSEKGIPELLEAVKLFKKGIDLKIAGSGPLEYKVGKYYIGSVSQDDLPTYFSASDVVIVPSTHEEGFGRVILESLACGTPVIASNRGAIPEVMDRTVGELIDVTPKNIKEAVNYFYDNPKKLQDMSKNARPLVSRKYSGRNLEQILASYSSKA